MQSQNPHNTDPSSIAGNNSEFLPADQLYGDIIRELTDEGENLYPGLIDRLDDHKLIDGLAKYAEQSGVPLKEYIRHSNRFAQLDRFKGLFDRSQPVTIPSTAEGNLDQYGQPRREETGHRLDLDYVRESGVDPRCVLFFRVTQPSDQPKLELYWTSDLSETKGGLGRELGSQAQTAVVLVSTLEDISHNGGLMDDMNDDSGIAVRQIGLDSFDQSQALLSIPRPSGPNW